MHVNMSQRARAQKVGLLAKAEEAWLTAVALDPGLAPALASLGHLEGARGNIERVNKDIY